MEGKWYTTSSGGGSGGLLLAVGAAILLGSGAAAAVAAAVVVTLIAVAAVVVLTAAGTVVFLVHRARNPSSRGIVPAPVRYELPGPQRPAIGPAVPRELHQHYHFHGGDEDRVAEILRRHQAE